MAVGDDHEGELARVAQAVKKLDDLVLALAVEVAGRLVGQEEGLGRWRAIGRSRCAGAGRRRAATAGESCGLPGRLPRSGARRGGFARPRARVPRTSGSGCSRARSEWASDRKTGRRSRPRGRGRRRYRAGRAACPRKKTSPSVGRSSPPRMCRSVLLPQPLGPVIATDSASLISSETPRRACTWPSG